MASLPLSKQVPAKTFGRADLDAILEATRPAIRGLLADGTPRSKRQIIASLQDRYPRIHLNQTILRMAVTGQLAMQDTKFSLPN